MSPTEIRIHTRDDTFQQIQSLRENRKKRGSRRLFLVEGVRSINAMRESQWPVDAYVYPESRAHPDASAPALSDWARQLLADSRASRHYLVPDDLMAELSDRDETPELLAVAVMTEPRPLESLPIGDPALVVIADRPASPGNLGTLLRSCDAFGADGLAIFGHAADLYDPRTIRAATGSWFSVPVAPVASPRALAHWIGTLRGEHPALQVVGTSASATASIDDSKFLSPTLLMLGNENSGLSRSLLDLCDRAVAIPIQGAASSLNLASAASILLYEIARQRRLDSNQP